MKDIQIIRIPSNSSSKEPLVWIATLGNQCIGHVRLSIEHNKIKFHDAWVDPDYRRQGIYTLLWETRDKYAKENFKDLCKIKVKKINKTKGMILTNGNDAAGLGCVYAGATVCAWYPITPSTSVAEAFTKYCQKFWHYNKI